jgi:hypothetical protein
MALFFDARPTKKSGDLSLPNSGEKMRQIKIYEKKN